MIPTVSKRAAHKKTPPGRRYSIPIFRGRGRQIDRQPLRGCLFSKACAYFMVVILKAHPFRRFANRDAVTGSGVSNHKDGKIKKNARGVWSPREVKFVRREEARDPRMP